MRKRSGFTATIAALAASVALGITAPASASPAAALPSASRAAALPSAIRHVRLPDGLSFPCGWRTTPPPVYAHVIWIWLENTSYNELIGSPSAPAFNLLSRSCGTATAYYGLTHPSFRNYIAATSGLGWQNAPPTCFPDDVSCLIPLPSLFEQVQDQGKQWRIYMESMPSNCDTTGTGSYTVYHNPALYYPDIADACARWDIPSGTPFDGALSTDLAAGTLPAFSFLIPDEDHDMAGTQIPAGDKWLGLWMARILTSREYLSGSTAVIVSFDEGDGADIGDVCSVTLDESCHVPTLIITPSTRPGSTSAAYFDHYSLLRTTEEMLGIPDYLFLAGEAASMRGPFNA